MTSDFVYGFIFGVVIVAIISFAVYRLLSRRAAELKFLKWKEEELSKEIAKALSSQRAVIKGKISEQLFPILQREIGSLSDFRFLGNPIDYIVFEGLSEAREGVDRDVNIKFIELKTGSSSLNKAERKVKEAIDSKRVEWKEIKL